MKTQIWFFVSFGVQGLIYIGKGVELRKVEEMEEVFGFDERWTSKNSLRESRHLVSYEFFEGFWEAIEDD